MITLHDIVTYIVHSSEGVDLNTEPAAEDQLCLQSILSFDSQTSLLGSLLLEVGSLVLICGQPFTSLCLVLTGQNLFLVDGLGKDLRRVTEASLKVKFTRKVVHQIIPLIRCHQRGCYNF